MKTILGIFGTVIGTIAALAVANYFVYGPLTNLSGMVTISVIIGSLNGGLIALASRRDTFSPAITNYAAAGAAGMGLLYIVLMGLLCLTLGMMFTMPSAKELFIKLVCMVAVGAFSGICYRAFASLR
jgi:hypothetical protein